MSRNTQGGMVSATPTQTASQVFTKYVGTLDVKSYEQPYMSLGKFSTENPAKGFSIALSEDTTDLVETHITTHGSNDYYELILHVMNNGSKPVRAEVWQM